MPSAHEENARLEQRAVYLGELSGGMAAADVPGSPIEATALDRIDEARETERERYTQTPADRHKRRQKRYRNRPDLVRRDP